MKKRIIGAVVAVVAMLLVVGCIADNSDNANNTERETAVMDAYELGYSEGESAGYDKGESDGYDKGYDEGYNAGYDEGHALGALAQSTAAATTSKDEEPEDSSTSAGSSQTGGTSGASTSLSKEEAIAAIKNIGSKLEDSTPNSYTVYITETGSKYHSSGCQYLRKSKIAISKTSAIASGYSACSKCRP